MEEDHNTIMREFFGESQAIQEHMSVAVVRMENVAGEYERLSASIGKFLVENNDMPAEARASLAMSIMSIDRLSKRCLEAADLEQFAIDIEEGLCDED